jgi:hypothetical protein
MHPYEIRPRKDGRGFDLISDALPSGRLWYLEVRQAIDYAKHQSRSHNAVIRVYDVAGKQYLRAFFCEAGRKSCDLKSVPRDTLEGF